MNGDAYKAWRSLKSEAQAQAELINSGETTKDPISIFLSIAEVDKMQEIPDKVICIDQSIFLWFR